MSIYHLYLDESETHDNTGNNRVFCIAGIIVEEAEYNNIIIPMLNRLKDNIWSDIKDNKSIILHEKDVRFAHNFRNRKKLTQVKSEFHRFVQNENIRNLYKQINLIFQSSVITVVGACVVIDDLNRYFNSEIISDKYIICMQMLLENFCHFLKQNDSCGYIFCESREEVQDKEIRMRFNHIKALGSMYISSYAMQKHLKEIIFPSKTDNNPGLQIADFVPNSFARYHGRNEPYRFNINSSLFCYRYDGGLQKPDRFGIKVLP